MELYLDDQKINNLEEVMIEDKSISFILSGDFTKDQNSICNILVKHNGVDIKIGTVYVISSIRFFDISKRMKVEVKLQKKKDK